MEHIKHSIALKGQDTVTKGAALRNKNEAAKALKGRNTKAAANAPAGLEGVEHSSNDGQHPSLKDYAPLGLGANYDLSVKNPNKPEEAALRSPEEILAEMQLLDEETNDILSTIKELI